MENTEEYFVEALIESSIWKTFIYHLTTNIEYVKCHEVEKRFTGKELKEITFNSEYLNSCIAEKSETTGEDKEKLKLEVWKYLDEIGMEKYESAIKLALFTRLFLCYMLKLRVFGSQPTITELKDSMGSSGVISLPTHRSYADFLFWHDVFLLNNIEYVNNASGTNLMNIPIFGNWFRKTGAYYIRRSIEDGSLYEMTLNEYVKTLLKKSPSLQNFFIEGTRCRTNKSQPPKYGLLAMCMAPVFSGEVSDITLAPIYIAHERLMENYLYACELLGIPKPPETFKSLYKACLNMYGSFGHIYLNFASPISVKQYLKDYDFKNCHKPKHSRDLTPEQFKLVQQLGDFVVATHQESTVVTITYLLATVLMNSIIKNELLDFDQVLADIDWLIRILTDLGAKVRITDVKKDLERILEVLSCIISIDEGRNVRLISAEVVNITEKLKSKIQGHVLKTETMENAVPIISLQLYVNPLLHFFVPATIIYLIVRNGSIKKDDLKKKYTRIRLLLKHDFFYFDKTESQNFETMLKFCEQQRVVIRYGESLLIGDNLKLIELLQWAIWPTLDTLLNTTEVMIKQKTSDHKTALKEIQEELEKRLCHPYSLSLDVITNCLQGLAVAGALRRKREGKIVTYEVITEVIEEDQLLIASILPPFNVDFTRQNVVLNNSLPARL